MTDLPVVGYREFVPADWPDVLVLVDERWVTGELRAWIRCDDGWDGYVQYRTAPGQNYLARFPRSFARRSLRGRIDEDQSRRSLILVFAAHCGSTDRLLKPREIVHRAWLDTEIWVSDGLGEAGPATGLSRVMS